MAPTSSKDITGREHADNELDSLSTRDTLDKTNTEQKNATGRTSENSSGNETTKVRFSIELPRRQEQNIPPDESEAPAHAPPGILKFHSTGRDRGYSLRRSLFTQNIQKQVPDNEGTAQLDLSKADGWKNDSHHSTSITVEESHGEPDNCPQKSVRLSDSELELPLYRRWMAKQSSRTTVLKALKENYRQLKHKIVRASTIPPSVDGRHVK